jgi:hypothetical protein
MWNTGGRIGIQGEHGCGLPHVKIRESPEDCLNYRGTANCSQFITNDIFHKIHTDNKKHLSDVLEYDDDYSYPWLYFHF